MTDKWMIIVYDHEDNHYMIPEDMADTWLAHVAENPDASDPSGLPFWATLVGNDITGPEHIRIH